uniref:Uncharacterized protein n=1 Tax=Caenorhabditis japonica TaxID=281687 RepID=A0A8R1DRX3_CAEJA
MNTPKLEAHLPNWSFWLVGSAFRWQSAVHFPSSFFYDLPYESGLLQRNRSVTAKDLSKRCTRQEFRMDEMDRRRQPIWGQ